MIRVAYSERVDLPELAVLEIREQLGHAKLVVLYANGYSDTPFLAKAIQQVFPDSITLGRSTANVSGSGWIPEKGFVALGVDELDLADLRVGVVSRLCEGGVVRRVRSVLSHLMDRHQESIGDSIREKQVGIVLTDGLSKAENQILEALASEAALAFVHDFDDEVESTQIFYRGRVHRDA